MERINIDTLNSMVAKGEKLLVVFSAEWCGQCKMTKMLIEQVRVDYPEIKIVEIDVDDHELWDDSSLNITSVPTFVGFNNKQTQFNQPGYQGEESLRSLFEQLK